MTHSVRRSLLAVSALAALASAGALVAVVPLARSGADQRRERAGDQAERELERLAERAERPVSTRLVPRDRAGARRSGWSGRVPTAGGLPVADGRGSPLPAQLRRALAADRERLRSGSVEQSVVALADGELVLARLRSGQTVSWAAVPVAAPAVAIRWQAGVLVLVLATLALVVASVHTLFAVERGTRALSRSLAELGADLEAPVVHSDVEELAVTGEGVEAMAATLRRARREEARLSGAIAEREQLASLGRLASGFAHEVRNPLAAMKLRIDLLQMTERSPGAVRDLREMAAQVAELDGHVASLVALAEREAV